MSKKVLVQLDYFMSTQFAGVAMAMRRGLYKRAQLDVHLLPTVEAGLEVSAALKAAEQHKGTGTAVIGLQEQNILSPLIASGAKVQPVAAMFGRSPLELAALPGDRRLASPGSNPKLRIGAHVDTVDLLQRVLPEADVIGVSRREKMDMLLNGKIDAVQVYSVMESLMLKARTGNAPSVYSLESLARLRGDPTMQLGYSQVLFSPTSHLTHTAAERVSLQEFLSTTFEGWTSAIQDPKAAASAVMETIKEVGDEEAAASRHWESTEQFAEDSIQACNDLVKLTRRGKILGSIDAERWLAADNWLLKDRTIPKENVAHVSDIWQPSKKALVGHDVARAELDKCAAEAAQLTEMAGRKPSLVVVTVGAEALGQTHPNAAKRLFLFAADEASWFNKSDTGKSLGVDVTEINLPTTTSTEELISELRKHSDADGVQLMWPLPRHIDHKAAYQAIGKHQDVDDNSLLAGGLVAGGDTNSITANAVMKLLSSHEVHISPNHHALVVGRSSLVGKPLAALLQKAGCGTISVASSETPENVLKELVQSADFVFSCVGKAGLIDGKWLKHGSVAVSVGNEFNPVANDLVPDISNIDREHDSLATFTASCPGGVGPLSVATLFTNVLANMRKRISEQRCKPIGATEKTENLSVDKVLGLLGHAGSSGWAVRTQGNGKLYLYRRVEFPSYVAAIDAMGRVTAIAEKMNHHPDSVSIGHHCVNGTTLDFALQTWSTAGGVSQFDIDLAVALDKEFPDSSMKTKEKYAPPPDLKMADFDYHLPDELIATHPAVPRGSSRLLLGHVKSEISERSGVNALVSHLTRAGQAQAKPSDKKFANLAELLPSNSLLICNDSQVFQARMFGNTTDRENVEVMFLNPEYPTSDPVNSLLGDSVGQQWRCMVRLPSTIALGAEIAVTLPGAGESVNLKIDKVHSVWEEHDEEDGVDATVTVSHTGFKSSGSVTMSDLFDTFGSVPIPPYLNRPADSADKDSYQTVFASEERPGSVAAPTAGLHFDPVMMSKLRDNGVQMAPLSLHVSAGTFRPVTSETVAGHDMHEERFAASATSLRKVVTALKEGRPVVVVGTTSVRTLETLYWLGARRILNASTLGGVDSAKSSEKQHFLGQWEPKAIEQSFAQIVNRDMPSPEEALESMCEAAERGSFDGLLEGSTRICIAPGYTFQAVDGLITNFHQPRSTLLLLVASFLGGKKPLQELYQHAVESKYRFLSYGDACLLINGQSSPAQHVSEDALRGDGEFASVPENRQRVLLHSCCAPCSGAMVEAMVADGLDVTVLFYNPNIHPKEEYELRKEENKKFCEKINVPFVDADYNDRDFFKRARGMEFDPERGRRCTMCFDMRMDYTAAYAREHGFDTISTTNATSRWKSQEQVDASGFRSAAKVDGVTYWGGEQWKNEEMTERKYRINADNAFYKQEYCGCAYSLRDVNEYRKEQLGLPPVRPGQGGFYSDPAIDAEEESQEVVDAFFADTLSEKKEESRRLKEIYRERKRSERAGADGNNW